MSVHLEISKKVKSVNLIIEEYKRLDSLREQKIEEVIGKARGKEDFSVDPINQVTRKLNQHAIQHHLPSRALVTKGMVLDACVQS